MFDDRGPSKSAFGLPTRRARPGNGPGGGANVETSRQWLGSISLIVFPLAIPLTRTVDPEGPLASLLGAHRCWERRTRQKLGETSHQPTVDPRHTSPRRQLILWLVLMTVLYNSGLVHRDHHRLRDQLRNLRRNTCWTAAIFRRLRVYTGRHAFHFSTDD